MSSFSKYTLIRKGRRGQVACLTRMMGRVAFRKGHRCLIRLMLFLRNSKPIAKNHPKRNPKRNKKQKPPTVNPPPAPL